MLYGCKLNLTHATKHINNIQQPFVYGWYPEKKTAVILDFVQITSPFPPPNLDNLYNLFSDVERQFRTNNTIYIHYNILYIYNLKNSLKFTTLAFLKK